MLTIEMFFFLKFADTLRGKPGEWSHITGQGLRLTGQRDGMGKGPIFPLPGEGSPWHRVPYTWRWVAMVITVLLLSLEPGTVQLPSSLMPHNSPGRGLVLPTLNVRKP